MLHSIERQYWVILLSGLSACSKGWRLPDTQAPAPHHRQVAAGSLAQSFEAPENAPLHPSLQTSCDRDFRPQVLEILEDVDRHAAQIEAFEREQSLTQTSRHPLTKLSLASGKEFVLSDDHRLTQESHASVSKKVPSWKDLIALHALLKNKIPQKAALETWSWLASSASYLVTRDELRLRWGYNFSTRRDEHHLLQSLETRIDECLMDLRCDPRPMLLVRATTQERSVIRRHKIYAELAALASSREAAHEERRLQLVHLKNWIKRDIEQISFTKNQRLTRSGPRRFEVDLDAGPLHKHRARVSEWVKVFWSNDEFKIDISWKDPLPDEIFRLNLIDVNAVPTVSHDDKTFNLPWLTNMRTFSHEFGHVLGLPDRYETLWNPETCQYTQTAWPEDLMSASWSGAVTPEHWNELDRHYPWKD